MTVPLIVSFYTPPYRQHAEQMMRTLDQFKLEHHVEQIEDRGTWRRNVGYKPRFLWDRQAEFDRPLIWLDVDARVRRFPVLLYQLNETCDFAAFFIPDVQPQHRPFGPKSKCEGVASGTMFWNVTARSQVLLHKWVMDEKANNCRYRFGQMVLGESWHTVNQNKHVNLRTQRLPQSYCKVFDANWKHGEAGPIMIEHMQASRKLRRDNPRRRRARA